LNALKESSGAQQVELAGEQEFRSQFPECELGAMPPFGNLYDMQVYMDQSLTTDDTIAFNAGSGYAVVPTACAWVRARGEAVGTTAYPGSGRYRSRF